LSKIELYTKKEGEYSYPNLTSGKIIFENVQDSNKKISADLSQILNEQIAGVSEITLDTGASLTMLPQHLAEVLGIPEPSKNELSCSLSMGVGSLILVYRSPTPIKLTLENEESISNIIRPCFDVCISLNIVAGRDLLMELGHHCIKVRRWLSPGYSPKDDFTIEIMSPEDDFIHPALPIPRRLPLNVNDKQTLDYILIGRDWQNPFNITFYDNKILIED
jgi:hypothetical protein